MLPRIPFAGDFRAFSKAGRKLADIHLNYETAKPYPVKEQRDELVLDEKKLYIVEKMRFGKSGKEVDKTKIQLQQPHHYHRHPARSLRIRCQWQTSN